MLIVPGFIIKNHIPQHSSKLSMQTGHGYTVHTNENGKSLRYYTNLKRQHLMFEHDSYQTCIISCFILKSQFQIRIKGVLQRYKLFNTPSYSYLKISRC